MSSEYYKRFRPKTIDEVLGQETAVAEIQKFIAKEKFPHCLLLTGPSGVGKTTIGRITRRMLKCHKNDYHEKDCTTIDKPLEFVKELKRSTSLHPMCGKVSVWFLEEFQSLSRSGFSQQGLLKLIEDCPDHVYFILATTDPDKILKTIHSRATHLRLNPVKTASMKELLKKVVEAEKLAVSDEVIDAIVDAAEGGARKALVILEQIGSLEGEATQLGAIDEASVSKDKAIKLAQMLMFGRPQWPEVAKVLRDVTGEDAEGLRYMILAFARSCLIGKEERGPNMKIAGRAYALIDLFSRNFFDSKHAGLAAACFEFLNSK